MEDKNQQITTAHYGGKAATLLALQQAGYPVPRLLVLPAISTVADTEAISEAQLYEWIRYFGEDALLAVRSSAVGEDGTAHSFAGQFTSLLNVPVRDLAQAINTVRRSAANESAKAYAQASGSNVPPAMGVILQQMVTATAAGVGFGINPTNGFAEVVINAVDGLGDKLVNGTANGDTYIVRDGEIVLRSSAGSVVLTDAQIHTVTACIIRLSRHYHHPQDIEFAFEGNDFYLLQCRPVTAAATAERFIWDNSNIIESYPGLTLLLTFSFIEKMYEAVYRQFSLVLGISPAVVARNTQVYAQMLGLLNGRVYYNLNSWYRALAQLPGYSLNAGFMEKMMGVKEKPDVDVSNQLNTSKWASWRAVAVAGYRIINNLRLARKDRESFVAAFNKIYNLYCGKNFAQHSLSALWADYKRFEALMLKEWKAPLSNDFFAMVYFGLLQKQCAAICPEEEELHNRLLAGSDDIITTEPLKRLPALAAKLAGDVLMKEACLHREAAAVWQLLQEPQYASVLREVYHYIDDWGERCVAELKLETISYSVDPLKLITVLQSYVANEIFTWQTSNRAAKERAEAESLIRTKLKGKPIRRRIFLHILKQARYFVSNRENLRYYRTRAFGMVRSMVLAFGQKLADIHCLDHPRDVFYLKLEELDQLATIPVPMQYIVAQRQDEYEQYATLPLPERIITNGRPGPLILMPDDAVATTTDNASLTGTPCSGGVVRGTVCKVSHASELASLNGGLLATYATDPGYVVLFPTASGILTERGSLLSHAAIVSREMGIPCIVGIEGLMSRIEDGDDLLMDGSTGVIRILNKA